MIVDGNNPIDNGRILMLTRAMTKRARMVTLKFLNFLPKKHKLSKSFSWFKE